MPQGSYNPRYQDTGFFLEKYVAHTGDNKDQIADADLNYNNNLRIYRFSETLLNAAELIVRGVLMLFLASFRKAHMG